MPCLGRYCVDPAMNREQPPNLLRLDRLAVASEPSLSADAVLTPSAPHNPVARCL